MQLTKKLSSKRNLLRGGAKTKHTKKIANTKNTRKSPSESATSMAEGTIRLGNDGQLWVIKKASNGVPRWMPYISVELNGFKALTVDYLAKNIGKEIEIYERVFEEEWPGKHDSWYMKYNFVTDGNVKIGKKIINNWLQNGDITKPIKDKKQPHYLLHRNNKAEVNFLIMDNTYINIIASHPYKHQAFVKA